MTDDQARVIFLTTMLTVAAICASYGLSLQVKSSKTQDFPVTTWLVGGVIMIGSGPIGFLVAIVVVAIARIASFIL